MEAVSEEELPVLAVDEERSFATHQCHGTGAIVGAPLLAAGSHTFVYEIHHSASGDGYGMHLGITDADPSPPTRALGEKQQRVWAFAPYDGCVHAASRVGDAWEVIRPITRRSLRSQVVGVRVEVRVDMSRKRLLFRINGDRFIDAGVTLPDVIRPCVTLASPGDAVSLGAAPSDIPQAASGHSSRSPRFLSPSGDAALLFASVRAARQQLFDAARDAAEERIRSADAEAAKTIEAIRASALADVESANCAIERAHSDARTAIENAQWRYAAAATSVADVQAVAVAEAAAEATARARSSVDAEKSALAAVCSQQLGSALEAAREESTEAIEELRESMADRLRLAEAERAAAIDARDTAIALRDGEIAAAAEAMAAEMAAEMAAVAARANEECAAAAVKAEEEMAMALEAAAADQVAAVRAATEELGTTSTAGKAVPTGAVSQQSKDTVDSAVQHSKDTADSAVQHSKDMADSAVQALLFAPPTSHAGTQAGVAHGALAEAGVQAESTVCDAGTHPVNPPQEASLEAEQQGALASAALEQVASLEAANAEKAKALATLEFELIAARDEHRTEVGRMHTEIAEIGDRHRAEVSDRHRLESARAQTELSIAREAAETAEARAATADARADTLEAELSVAHDALARERAESAKLRDEVAMTWQSCLHDMKEALAAEKAEAAAAHDAEVSRLHAMLLTYQQQEQRPSRSGHRGLRSHEDADLTKLDGQEEDDDDGGDDEARMHGDQDETDVDALLAWSDALSAAPKDARSSAENEALALGRAEDRVRHVTNEQERNNTRALGDWKQSHRPSAASRGSETSREAAGVHGGCEAQRAQAVAGAMAALGLEGAHGPRSLEAILASVMAATDATEDDGWAAEEEGVEEGEEEGEGGLAAAELLELGGFTGALRKLRATRGPTEEEELLLALGETMGADARAAGAEVPTARDAPVRRRQRPPESEDEREEEEDEREEEVDEREEEMGMRAPRPRGAADDGMAGAPSPGDDGGGAFSDDAIRAAIRRVRSSMPDVITAEGVHGVLVADGYAISRSRVERLSASAMKGMSCDDTDGDDLAARLAVQSLASFEGEAADARETAAATPAQWARTHRPSDWVRFDGSMSSQPLFGPSWTPEMKALDSTVEEELRKGVSPPARPPQAPAASAPAPPPSMRAAAPTAQCFACPDSSELPQAHLQRCPSCRGLFHVRCFVSHKCSGRRHHSAPPSPNR